MKTIGIIAEYNPFHNGHLYHLHKSKQLTGCDYTVAIVSGNFLQRGIPALWDKYTRGKMSTTMGVDLALELPFPYATGSAKDFSSGAISILDSLNTIDYLCFGAETDDIDMLNDIASIINEEPGEYKASLTELLSQGMSYPQARTIALSQYLSLKDKNLEYIVSQPNNILAIEYVASLQKINSDIKPVIIKRTKAMYHDKTLYGSISSATAIRSKIYSKDFDHISILKDDIPVDVCKLIEDTHMSTWPIHPNSLTQFLQYRLINSINYSDICDISQELSNKLINLSPNLKYEAIIDSLSSKEITKTRICRSLIHLLLEYKESHRSMFIDNKYAFYANILSLRKDSSSLIKTINKNSKIPLITKKADFNKYLDNYPNINKDVANIMWNYDMKATALYNCLVYNTFGTTLPNDYNIKLPVI